MSIGEALVEARLAAGLTTADVAEATRIRRTLVEAIEHDDYALCGGDVYARGHIGTIARTVGLDPAVLLAEFDAAHKATAPQGTRVFESETTVQPERRGPNWVAAMVAALILVVGLGVWQVARRGDGAGPLAGGPGSTVSSTPDPTRTTASPSAPPRSPSPTPTSSDIAKAPTGVTVVVLAANDRSWISVVEGGKQVFQGILEAGQSKQFSDPDRVKLVIGNAGAVRLTVNGSNLGAPGTAGQVARLSFGPGDPTAAG